MSISPSVTKSKLSYHCTQCENQATKWSGQCGLCGAWNSMVEVQINPAVGNPAHRNRRYGEEGKITSLAEVSGCSEDRILTELSELDRVLGGGLVVGSVVLIGGDPGIGKSTLLLQALAKLGEKVSTLYVSGEESLQQISLRAMRLGVPDQEIQVLSETRVDRILALIGKAKPSLVVIDSIQTMHTEFLQAAAGSVGQVRESAAQLVQYAKQTNTTLLLVGHVTKEGTLAGPKILEHMVDTVLYFEGQPTSRYRMIRAVKNRYGAVNEVGMFAMTNAGLRPVSNPSAMLLSRHNEAISGSTIVVINEGTRPMLMEIQALVTQCQQANPRRVCVGLDNNRLTMLLAVLQRHGNVSLYDHDVFVNVVGGMRITETAVDMAITLAILSSFYDRPLPVDMVVFGEIGLTGEIRPVQNGQQRIHEAIQHGFKQAVIPKANAPRKNIDKIELRSFDRFAEAIQIV